MSDFQFTCPHCNQQLEVSEDDLGQTVLCPTCQEQITLAKPTPALRVARIATVAQPPARTVDQKPLVMRMPARRQVHLVSQVGGLQNASRVRLPGQQVTAQPPPLPNTAAQSESVGTPLFLYIPLSRLIFMSFLSFGLYECYWVYKNWRYVKERDNLKISPVSRGWFIFFYCLQLFQRIHDDKVARSVQMPQFSPGWLFTGWFTLSCIAYGLTRYEGSSFVAPFIPTFLFFLPVQRYVNTVCKKRNPAQTYYHWSSGHVVCVIWGITIWSAIFLITIFGAPMVSDNQHRSALSTALSVSDLPPGAPAVAARKANMPDPASPSLWDDEESTKAQTKVPAVESREDSAKAATQPAPQPDLTAQQSASAKEYLRLKSVVSTNLTTARSAREYNNWNEVLRQANAALALINDNAAARSLRDEAEALRDEANDNLTPRLILVATLNSNEVPALLSDGEQEWTTPVTLKLVSGHTFNFNASYENTRHYGCKQITVTANWQGRKKSQIVLVETLPAKVQFVFPVTNVIYSVFDGDRDGNLLGTSDRTYDLAPFKPHHLTFKAVGWQDKEVNVLCNEPGVPYRAHINMEPGTSTLPVEPIPEKKSWYSRHFK